MRACDSATTRGDCQKVMWACDDARADQAWETVVCELVMVSVQTRLGKQWYEPDMRQFTNNSGIGTMVTDQ